jgi:hypothetical protein
LRSMGRIRHRSCTYAGKTIQIRHSETDYSRLIQVKSQQVLSCLKTSSQRTDSYPVVCRISSCSCEVLSLLFRLISSSSVLFLCSCLISSFPVLSLHSLNVRNNIMSTLLPLGMRLSAEEECNLGAFSSGV